MRGDTPEKVSKTEEQTFLRGADGHVAEIASWDKAGCARESPSVPTLYSVERYNSCSDNDKYVNCLVATCLYVF